jgi:hypothetical protein
MGFIDQARAQGVGIYPTVFQAGLMRLGSSTLIVTLNKDSPIPDSFGSIVCSFCLQGSCLETDSLVCVRQALLIGQPRMLLGCKLMQRHRQPPGLDNSRLLL